MKHAKIFTDKNGLTIVRHSSGEIQILPMTGSIEGHYMAFVPVRHAEGVDDGVNGRPLTGIPHQQIEQCMQEIRDAYPSLLIPYAPAAE